VIGDISSTFHVWIRSSKPMLHTFCSFATSSRERSHKASSFGSKARNPAVSNRRRASAYTSSGRPPRAAALAFSRTCSGEAVPTITVDTSGRDITKRRRNPCKSSPSSRSSKARSAGATSPMSNVRLACAARASQGGQDPDRVGVGDAESQTVLVKSFDR
jgi:hypothetical protein